MSNKVLITGATGLVGMNLIKELLSNSDFVIYVLIRRNNNATAIQRFERLKDIYFSENEKKSSEYRIIVLEGDVEKKFLGLPEPDYVAISKNISLIFHSAASIRFDMNIDEARNINVIGTKNVLELAKKCRTKGNLERFVYISTAYIIGNSEKVFHENEIDIGQSFFNTYEKSKFEAELIVNQYKKDGLPVNVFRPSIIGSHSKTGEATDNCLIFGFIRQFAKINRIFFICNHNSSINLIPVDYFIKGMMSIISRRESLNRNFHLVNENETSIMNLLKWISECLRIDTINFMPINQAYMLNKRIRECYTPLFPYMERKYCFDDIFAKSFLDKQILDLNVIDKEYIRNSIDFGIRKKLIKNEIKILHYV